MCLWVVWLCPEGLMVCLTHGAKESQMPNTPTSVRMDDPGATHGKVRQTRPLSRALSHTHTHTHTQSLSHSHKHTHKLSLTHTHTLSLTHTHTPSLTHSDTP